MWIAPEIAPAAMSGEGMRLGFPLAGWEERSVWGWDSGVQSLFAQLYMDGEDDWEPPPGARWVTPPRYPQTGSPEQLAERIAAATGAAVRDVLAAMADALGERGERLRLLVAGA